MLLWNVTTAPENATMNDIATATSSTALKPLAGRKYGMDPR